ncbi:conserved hypothetical protein [Mesorhizobium sp. SOD10]|nr:conserved hypothetical protein [Mesorhizobium sp. SOD10]
MIRVAAVSGLPLGPKFGGARQARRLSADNCPSHETRQTISGCLLAPLVYRDSGQAEPKMVAVENRSGAYFSYVSTGSAGSRHLQPASPEYR